MKPNFDEFQQEVINAQDDILVIAGPGSGKTTTILAKVEHLLESCQEEDILLISFTNKSVEDIKKRLKCDLKVMTFHKLAIDILKYNQENFEIASPFLLDEICTEYLLSLEKKTSEKLCRVLGILKLNKYSLEFNSLKNLIKTFINLFKTNNHNFALLDNLVKNYEDKFLLKIIFDIFKLYEEEKKSIKAFDFDDLIVKATEVLKKKKNYYHFKYIIVDEFQDTSLIRLNLIKEIYQMSQGTITAVGDDAQSIFHFSGCDLNIFLGFKKHFPNARVLYLKNTYRNSQEIINISEGFINKNPCQMPKGMQSKISLPNPIQLIYYWNPVKALKKVLDNLDGPALILGRNKKDIYAYLDKEITYNDGIVYYKDKEYTYLTIHSSKGLEEKYVIVLNNANSKYGLPNKIEDHPILNYINSEVDNYPYAEERRVFFVAITRCKCKTFLLIPKANPSCFIKEIKKLV